MTKLLAPEWKENNDYWFNVASSILVDPYIRQADLERQVHKDQQQTTDQTPKPPISLWDIY